MFGNLKFDATPNAAQLAQPVLMFASLREGKEVEFLEKIMAFPHKRRTKLAMNSVANGFQTAFKTLIVPRHPQRFDEVEALIERHGLRRSRSSK